LLLTSDELCFVFFMVVTMLDVDQAVRILHYFEAGD
jgi:hypothetical protein